MSTFRKLIKLSLTRFSGPWKCDQHYRLEKEYQVIECPSNSSLMYSSLLVHVLAVDLSREDGKRERGRGREKRERGREIKKERERERERWKRERGVRVWSIRFLLMFTIYFDIQSVKKYIFETCRLNKPRKRFVWVSTVGGNICRISTSTFG